MHDGWKSARQVFLLAIVMDAIYQLMVIRKFYPGEAVLVAVILAIVPYLLIRGPVNQIARPKTKKAA